MVIRFAADSDAGLGCCRAWEDRNCASYRREAALLLLVRPAMKVGLMNDGAVSVLDLEVGDLPMAGYQVEPWRAADARV